MGETKDHRRTGSRSALWVSIVAIAALGGAAAPAGAASFGAAFAAPVNNTETCSSASWYNAGPQSSCTFWSLDPGGVYYAPTSGTVTAVRVKSAPSPGPGPYQVVVLYTLRQNNRPPNNGHPITISDPYVSQLGPVVPATPDAPTIATSLPMIEQPPPPPDDYTSVTRNDFLAISVLDPNTAIPAMGDPNAFLKGAAPAPGQGNPYASYVGSGMGYIALNADFEAGTPAAGGTPTTGPGGPKALPAAPAAALRPVTINPKGSGLKGNTGLIPLTCALTAACNGALTLGPPGAHAAVKKKAKKPSVYGSTPFSIPAGHTQVVRVKLNATGRKKLKGHKSLKVTASATVGGKSVTAALTLKQAAKKKHKKK